MSMSMFGLKKTAKSSNMDKEGESYREKGLRTNPSNYGWYTCVHCGKKFRKGSIEIDHIIPRSKGGSNRPENLQCLCVHCNRSKGNKTDQTKADLRERKRSLGQVKRQSVLTPKLQGERKKLRDLMRQLSADDIVNEIKKCKDADILKDLRREAKRRGLQI